MATLKHQTYSDNVDTDLLIDGNEWLISEARVELTLGHKADYVDFIAVPTQETQSSLPSNPEKPADEGGLLGKEFKLDVTPQLDEGDRGQKTRIFTGALSNLTATGTGAWEGLAYDPSYRVFNEGSSFMNDLLYLPAATGAEDLTEDTSQVPEKYRAFVYGGGGGGYTGLNSYGSDTSYNTPSGTKLKASALAALIAEEAGISDYSLHFAENGLDQGEGNRAGYDYDLYFSEDFVSVDEALKRLETSTDSVWWFDREGTLHIGGPVVGEPVDEYDLIFITDTTAGLSTPAYRSVRVIGSGVVSNAGWAKTNLNPEEPVIVEGSDTDDPLQAPTFTYRNMAIQTQAEAEAARDRLLNKFKEQQASGKITIVGMPEVRPRDLVRLPNSDIQPMGGTEFGVTKVIHKVNGSDGFKTDVHVGGVLKEHETLTVEQEPSQYGRFYAYIQSDSASSGGPGWIR